MLDALRTTGHADLDLSIEQMAAFAGNMLELRSARGTGSRRDVAPARSDSLTARAARGARTSIGGPIVAAPIPTIETLGGGSVRCMLAEIHLPRKK